MKSELFQCGGDCGLLYPLLVDHRGTRACCVACGAEARRLSEPEIIDELRRRMSQLVGEARGPQPVDTSPVDIHARLRAAQQVGDILRHLESPAAGRPEGPLRPW
ncbi:MAG TPA: hypothetical protein VNZ52_04110 [Candidatus Thermoplasmatota archaeon]|nr:hypothetical protein [Candidatus Thermoplasmatota archaeon]